MKPQSLPMRRALISVTDKRGIASFVKSLKELLPQCEIIASGGTAKTLSEENIPFTPLSEFTGFPECFQGRLKTLHPNIAGGILMRRDEDREEAAKLGIKPIDLIVCNLYDFYGASLNAKLQTAELIESLDIGGSTLIRSGCKNFKDVAVVVDPDDYPFILTELKENQGTLSLKTRERLAVKGLNTSADYEAHVANVISKRLAGEENRRPYLRKGKELRYGENPDQKAWVYHLDNEDGIANAQIHAGKELSFNNYEDATVAYRAAQELLSLGVAYGVAIIKHGSLCSYATGNTLAQAFALAWEGDSKSAYGSVIAFTAPVTLELEKDIRNKFVEVLIAPGFSAEFIAWVKENKPKVRLLQVANKCDSPFMYKNISGGMLVQTQKEKLIPENFAECFKAAPAEGEKRIGVVTKIHPSQDKRGLYAFGIAAVNFAKSNAVAIVREPAPGIYQLIGMGAGQPNRVDSLERLAIPKAIENLQQEHGFDPAYDPKTELEKCVLASDGFFPFDDSIKYAAKHGLKHCIQPGGSLRDREVIEAADRLGMCMVFTGNRYFYH